MCEFLVGSDNNTRRKISELTEHVSVERHAADALFSAMTDQHDESLSEDEKYASYRMAKDMYSRLLQARSDRNFSGIVTLAHQILGEE